MQTDASRGFTNAKEFEYSFKKSSVENIKPTSSQPYERPLLQKSDKQATDDIDQRINWFKSDNARMEYRSDNSAPPRPDYLRVEENRSEMFNQSAASKKPTTVRGTSRDGSIVSSANILNELPLVSEIRNPSHPVDSKPEMGNLESLNQNFFGIPHVPGLGSISTPDKLDISSVSAPPQPEKQRQSRPTAAQMQQSQQHPREAAIPGTTHLQQLGAVVPIATQSQTQMHDIERQRLQTLVEAQTKLIAEMQTQLQRERLKTSLPRTTITTAAGRDGPTGVSQSSLDSMFQTYLARQTNWTALRRDLGVSTPGLRVNDSLQRNREAASSSFLGRSQEAQPNVVSSTMQPKLQAIELKRKKSIRSTSTSRLSIKSGLSVNKKQCSSPMKNVRKEKSADPRVKLTQKQRETKKSKSRGAQRPAIAHLEPETLALLGAALQKNKAKTRMFVEKLKALVAEVVGDSSKRKRSTTRSKSREMTRKQTKKRDDVCTLESLSHVISSQRSHGSTEKKRKRVK